MEVIVAGVTKRGRGASLLRSCDRPLSAPIR